jgi:hypothetical protein
VLCVAPSQASRKRSTPRSARRFDLAGNVGIVFQERLGVFAALADALAVGLRNDDAADAAARFERNNPKAKPLHIESIAALAGR